MIIAIDFDGTIVDHQFPEIGEPRPFALQTLKKWKKDGHSLILWTCRNDVDPALNGRKILTEAVDFLHSHQVFFDAINKNVQGLGFDPVPKVYADLYIDDRMLGIIDWPQLDIAVSLMAKNNYKLRYIPYII